MIEDGGGLKSTFELVKESISPKFKVVKYNNLSHIFKIIVSKKESAFLFIGYADSHIIYSFTLSLLSNAKIIYLPAFHPWNTMRRKYLAYIYEKYIFKFFLKRSALILCLSKMESDTIKDIYHGANTQVIKISSPILNNLKKIKKNQKKSIIFIGRDDHNKNMDYFINLSKEIKSITSKYDFIVISNTKRKLPNYIQIKSDLSESELLKIYIKCVAIVVPSYWESFSIVGLEAIKLGGKLICNKNVMLGNYANDFPSLIMNETSNVNKILSFINSPIDELEFTKFNDEFSIEKIKKEIHKILAPFLNI